MDLELETTAEERAAAIAKDENPASHDPLPRGTMAAIARDVDKAVAEIGRLSSPSPAMKALVEACEPLDVLGEETPAEANRPDYWDAIASCGRIGRWDLGHLRRLRAALALARRECGEVDQNDGR